MQDTFPRHKIDSKKLRASDNGDMIGQSYLHSKNNRLYTVEAFVWNCVTDEWNVLYRRVGTDIKFVRALTNFNGEFESGVRRFILIKED